MKVEISLFIILSCFAFFGCSFSDKDTSKKDNSEKETPREDNIQLYSNVKNGVFENIKWYFSPTNTTDYCLFSSSGDSIESTDSGYQNIVYASYGKWRYVDNSKLKIANKWTGAIGSESLYTIKLLDSNILILIPELTSDPYGASYNKLKYTVLFRNPSKTLDFSKPLPGRWSPKGYENSEWYYFDPIGVVYRNHFEKEKNDYFLRKGTWIKEGDCTFKVLWDGKYSYYDIFVQSKNSMTLYNNFYPDDDAYGILLEELDPVDFPQDFD